MANSLKSTIARRAAKTTAKHTAHGTARKLKRAPLRSTTLLAVGGVLGFLAGRLATPSSSA